MGEVLQANIFFIITSITVVVFMGLLSIALYYAIGILRNVREITDRIRRASEQLEADASAVRAFVREGIVGTVKHAFMGTSEPKRPPVRHRKMRDIEPRNDTNN